MLKLYFNQKYQHLCLLWKHLIAKTLKPRNFIFKIFSIISENFLLFDFLLLLGLHVNTVYTGFVLKCCYDYTFSCIFAEYGDFQISEFSKYAETCFLKKVLNCFFVFTPTYSVQEFLACVHDDPPLTLQKIKSSIKYFFSKCD